MVLHLCEGRLHYAPLKNPQQVVDIGTGTGVWAIDSALWRSVHSLLLFDVLQALMI
jgi:methylase of polypeptide subunit release factors